MTQYEGDVPGTRCGKSLVHLGNNSTGPFGGGREGRGVDWYRRAF
jgi:hypothetical protein